METGDGYNGAADQKYTGVEDLTSGVPAVAMESSTNFPDDATMTESQPQLDANNSTLPVDTGVETQPHLEDPTGLILCFCIYVFQHFFNPWHECLDLWV